MTGYGENASAETGTGRGFGWTDTPVRCPLILIVHSYGLTTTVIPTGAGP